MHKTNNKQNHGVKLCRGLLFYLFLLPVFPGTANSQNIGNWTFNSILTGVSGSFNTISIADFSTGVPVHSFNGGSEYFGEGVWPAGGINTNMYLEFTILPLPGYQLDITSLMLRIRRSNTGTPAGAGPTSWSLRSSTDGFSSDIASGSMTLTYANYAVPLTSSFLNQYLPVVFRLYGYNSTVNPGGISRLVIDNITATGLGYLLPVKLGALSATISGDNPALSFIAYETEKDSHYTVERSGDGISFTSITDIVEKENAAEKKYSYADNTTSVHDLAAWYYRIHVISSAGMHSHSANVLVKMKSSVAQVRSFISKKQLYISGSLLTGGEYFADLHTTSGQLLAHIPFTASSGYNTFSFPLDKFLPAACVVHVYNKNGWSVSTVSVNNP